MSELSSMAERAVRTEGILPLPYDTAKLARPFNRQGTVERSHLLERMTTGGPPPVVSVIATAGYGKSTLLRQWADGSARPFAWLTLDFQDNDPVVLLTYLVAALDQIVPLDPRLFDLLEVDYPPVASVTAALGRTLLAAPQPGILILDDVHTIENPACHDILANIADHVPEGSQIAMASRAELPLPVARLRADGRIVELWADDLALDEAETRLLLTGIGVDLADPAVTHLTNATEGWPVAVYLAGRSARGSGARATLNTAHLGQAREIIEYAHAELLASLPARTVQFLTRSSVLEHLSGPMCDAVLKTFGSAERLEQLARSHLLVIPMDDHRSWYRYHPILRELLRAELERNEPDILADLHRRASVWCEANGRPDAAVDYAIAADDVDRAAHIVEQRAHPLYRAGRIVTLMRWFEWFDRGGHLSSYSGVAVGAAWTAALTGRAAAAERWADDVQQARSPAAVGTGAEPNSGAYELLQALLCRGGMECALADAEEAARLVPLDNPWRPATMVLLGLNRLYSGLTDAAEAAFIQAAEGGSDTGALPAASVAVAQRALIASWRGDTDLADALAAQACVIVGDVRLEEQATNVLVFAVAAQAAMRNGDVGRAESLVTQAHRLRPRLTYAIPHVAVQSRLEVIRVMLHLSDGPGARTVLREVDDILRVRPDLGVLAGQTARLRERVAGTPPASIGASSLTTAELRLLPLLQTHLKFREIGTRLYVSPNTVKTQAVSIYRKLGVSSRSEAMRVAADLGLLPG